MRSGFARPSRVPRSLGVASCLAPALLVLLLLGAAASVVAAPVAAGEEMAAGMDTAPADVLTPWDVARLSLVTGAEASPDGTHVAYTRYVQRDLADEDNGPAWIELHVVGPDGVSRPYVTGEVNVSNVAWTPDGSRIAFTAKRDGDEESALYAIPLAGGEARRVLSHETGVEELAFSPDGRRVAFLAEAPQPKAQKEAEEKGFDAEVFEEDWRPVELWIAALGDDGTAGEAKKLELPGSASSLSWSPAGDRLALALAPTSLVDDSYMQRRVKIVDPESGEITAEIANPGKLGQVVWSPDGRNLALVSAADLNDPIAGRLTVVPVTGGVPREVMPGFLGDVSQVEWLDSVTLVYLAQQRVSSFIATVDLDGTPGTTLVPTGDTVWEEMSLLSGGGLALLGESASHPSELYRMLPGGAPERLTDSNPWLAGKRLARQEVVTFEARDGLELDAVLIHPLDEVAGKRYPLLLTVHGGPESHHVNGWMTGYSLPGQVGAARGFAVLYVNYRGSTGRGVEFAKSSQGDPAGLEFRDLVDAVDHLIASGLVDRDRVGITGGSYGGYATAWGSTYYSDRFAAGVMFVGISDKVAKLGISDIPNEEYLVHAREWPWEDWQKMLERSPIYYVEKARTPLLIMGGTADTRVNPAHSLVLYRYLKLLGQTPVRLVRYPGEHHGNRNAAARLDYNLRMLRWFEHYLQGPGGAPPPPAIDHLEPGSETEEPSSEEGTMNDDPG